MMAEETNGDGRRRGSRADNNNNDSNNAMNSILSRIRLLAKEREGFILAGCTIALAILCSAPMKVIGSLWHVIMTSIGMAIGVGVGLGLAMHVYERLQTMQKANDEQRQQQNNNKSNKRRSSQAKTTNQIIDGPKIKQPKSTSKQHSNRLEDGTSYASLMSSAGYYIGDKVLRGQVLKSKDSFWDVQYKFTTVTVDRQHGPRMLHEDWPSLPEPVTRELGRFIEHIMRDYISTWYSRLDAGCIHFDERQRRKEGIPRDGGTVGGEDQPPLPNTTTISSPKSTNGKSERTEDEDTNVGQNNNNIHRPSRKMVFSTKTYRYIPMIDQTYKTLSAAFGNLAIRAEHVNIFSLALLKWTHILAHTFKVYRLLRGMAQTKNNTENPTEIQITREFLLAGKLHRAVTFGLDVPSLLFADTNGKDCGTGTDKPPTTDPDQVLEQRLYGTRILADCELDYNRVVAHRLIRALIPKSDSASHVTLALLVEIFSFAVLQPIMNLWIPSFLNNAIKRATQKRKPAASNNVNSSTRASEDSSSSPASSANESKTKNSSGTLDDTHLKGSHASYSENLESAGVKDLPGQKFKSRASAGRVADLGDVQSSVLTKETSTNSIDSSSEFLNELDFGSTNSLLDDTSLSAGEIILRLTCLALEDLQKFMDFDQCRLARAKNIETEVDWDDPLCQEAVLKLVMVIEAAILHGQVKPPPPQKSSDDPEDESGWSSPESSSMSQVLMQMTSNMDAFEESITRNESQPISIRVSDDRQEEDYEPDASEISTLRTLISTWLHTGQGYRALSLLVKGNQTLLRPFYSRQAFLQDRSHADDFLAKLEVLDSLDVMVETMATLAMPKMDLEAEASLILSAATEELATDVGQAANVHKEYRRVSATSLLRSGSDEQASGNIHDSLALFPGVSNARYLDFHRNAAFASSLRSERERRMRSWASLKADESLQSVCRKSALPDDRELHRELHNLSRTFYNGTNLMTIRDAARKSETAEQPQRKTSGDQEKVSLLTVETVSNRRRIEVPDDDSSFLLRAQPRPLNPVSVHRDDRNHDQSYKCFLATYEEPAFQLGSNRFSSGRYIRRCFLQYYPGDRTALIVPHSDARKLDRRKGLPRTKDTVTPKSQTSPSYLSGPFLKNRHLCQKWIAKGTGTQNFLSSSVMEASDFNAIPRSGRALDFVFRMSLFEKPVVDLAGKRFIVQDSAGRGAHRADASSLEISDASLSALLMTIGRDPEAGERKAGGAESTGTVGGQMYRHRVEMGPDGYPMIFMKFSAKHGDQVSTEIKPYRLSFVRAALIVTSARQEAQLQCLIECVKAGSAKSATKSRTEAQLRPTLKILEYANDRSPDKSKSSSLLRDLKLGVYHIDREQLRRNGLLNPRSPTFLVALNAKVEGAVQAKDIPETIGGKLPQSLFLYKVRCVALVELLGIDEEADDMEPYYLDDGSLARQYREEWVIYRSMKDFQALHRHLKSEVAAGESSASTGSRLVGAATSAFVNSAPDRKHRKALIPSLAQASKTGAIAITKKAVARRGELLDKYLEYLLMPNHLLSRCTGLLLFLGASFPFPPEVRVMKTPPNLIDPLGRLSFIRSVTQQAPKNLNRNIQQTTDGKAIPSLIVEKTNESSTTNGKDDPSEPEDAADIFENLSPAVLNKVDQVPLGEVRNRVVELIRYQFGFENASFFRSQMLSALETASFVANMKATTFRKLLHDLHIKHLNPEALAGWIRRILDILWPDGVWMTPPPPFTEQEEAELRAASREGLHRVFPDQISIILGEELTRDGLDLVHEMLQNRLVVKSLFYMLFDTLWLEVFPEFRDVCTGADALDIE